jgi:MFS family permease
MIEGASVASVPPPDHDRLLSRDFVVLAIAAMLAFAAFGAINPVLPLFVTDELGGSDTQVGIVIGAFAVSAIVVRPLLGRLGDRRGLRVLLVGGPAVAAVGIVANVMVGAVPEAIGARLVMGAGQAATMTGATTMAVNLAPVSRRGEASSYVLVAFHLGLGLGPLAGEAILDAASFEAVWLTLAGLLVVAAAVACALPAGRVLFDDDAPKGGLFQRTAIAPGIVMGAGVLGFTGLQAYVVLFSEHIGMDRAAPIFLANSLTIAVVRIFGARLPDRLGPVRAGTVALILVTASLLLVAGWQQPAGLLTSTVLGAAGLALFFPSLVPAAVAGVPESQRASAMATFTMFIDAAGALGGPLFGFTKAFTGDSYAAALGAGAISSLFSLGFLHLYLAPRLDGRRRLDDVADLELEAAPVVDTA